MDSTVDYHGREAIIKLPHRMLKYGAEGDSIEIPTPGWIAKRHIKLKQKD